MINLATFCPLSGSCAFRSGAAHGSDTRFYGISLHIEIINISLLRLHFDCRFDFLCLSREWPFVLIFSLFIFHFYYIFCLMIRLPEIEGRGSQTEIANQLANITKKKSKNKNISEIRNQKSEPVSRDFRSREAIFGDNQKYHITSQGN